MIRRIIALAATAALAAACGPRATPPWHEATGYRWRALDVRGRAPGFTALAADRTGIEFRNAASDSILRGNRVLGQGAGVSLGDVDGDGRVDLFLARTEGCSALYRNQGDWQFVEVAREAGVGACDRHASGSALADLDGDGDLDLVLLATTGPNAVFVNDGSGRFTERRDLGLDSTGRGGTTVTLADIDGSGRLALFVANYKPYFVDDTIPPQRRAFNQMVRELGAGRYEVVPAHRRDYKLVIRPDMGGLRITQRAEPDELYLADAGRLRRVTPGDARFRDANGRTIAEWPESFGLGAVFADLSGDGAPDLYVANDFEDTDELWFNDGKGNFRQAPWTAQRQISNSTMGVDVGDVNGDGLADLFCVDMLANDSRRRRTQIPTSTAFPKTPGETEMQLQHQRNTLFLNRGDGTLAEVAQYAGVGASGWSWGTMFLDVDLDGWQDILVATGHLWDIMDADIQEGLQNRLATVPWQEIRWQFPRLALPNVAFRNRGDLTFEDVSAAWGVGREADVSHGMAAADLDGDGDLDVVVNRLGAQALVLRNDAAAPRVAVRLAAAAPNTRAVGATLRLTAPGLPVQSREVRAGGLYMSHSDYLVAFAMGAADSAALDIRWRDGRRSTLTVRPNRLYEITDATASPAGAPAPSAATTGDSALFRDATPMLRGHRHAEPEFDDWGRQFLLPDALSPLGPGVAWFDVDRDGAEDLLVGAARGGRVALFRNAGGSLVPSGRFPPAPTGLTELVGTADSRGARVLAGASTWQALSDSEMVSQPAVLGYAMVRGAPPARAAPVVGSHAASTGPIAAADYDADGDLDLFVGSRAVPLRYPLPASSGLFRNMGGAYVLDTVNTAALRDVGLVSSATFADVNGDGHADLVLAREWASLQLLLNDRAGRFAPAPATWGLGRWTSRWIGVAAGDLDGDGRLDLVATSWGRNTALRADSANPLVLLHGPIGARGEEEMILAQRDPRVGGLAPITTYARARVAIPALASSVGTFGAWADATAERALGPALSQVSRLAAHTLDQMLFLNRGDRFDPVTLPLEAQLAPAFAASIADFDGDGDEDLFLSQNFSGTMVGLPRADAGRGLLLRNDGAGQLAPRTGAQSGIVVYGDQRGAAHADFDGDGRLDLAVAQNAGVTRLFRNQGARPGLRVRLRGGPDNPDAVGAQVRVTYADRLGPVREVQAGAGYYSQNGAVQVFGLAAPPTAVWVRWPGGQVTRVPVKPGTRELEVRQALR